jgi:hypothetical protein
LADLCVFMEAHPPTGEAAWCEAVEEEAARLYGLGDGDFWDRTSAPGYRLLLMLPDTPAELRDLPLDDRMWICKMNQPFMKGLTGDASDRLARMYQLAYTQYLGQRSHPLGIQSDNEYIATAGFDPMVPLDDELRRSIPTKFQLSLYLPQEAPEPEPLRSLARPYTLIADVLHEISPAQRARLEWFADRGPARRQRKQVYCDYFGAGLIPFGDLYHFDSDWRGCEADSQGDWMQSLRNRSERDLTGDHRARTGLAARFLAPTMLPSQCLKCARKAGRLGEHDEVLDSAHAPHAGTDTTDSDAMDCC